MAVFFGRSNSTVTEVSLQAIFTMTDTTTAGGDPETSAKVRLAGIEAFYERLRERTDMLLNELGTATTVTPAQILKKIDDMEKAHLCVLTAEDAFHAKFAQDLDADKIDFDAIRAELGGKLDRLRAALDTEAVSEDADR